MSIENIQVVRAPKRLRRRRLVDVQSKREAHPNRTISDRFASSYQRAGFSGEEPNRLQREMTPISHPQSAQVSYRPRPARHTRRARRVVRNHPSTMTIEAMARARATSVTLWVNGWAFFMYLVFQLPFAIASTAGLGMAAAIYAAVEYVDGMEGVTGFITRGAVAGIEGLAGAFGATLSELVQRLANAVFGISFDPLVLFFVGFLMIFAFGALQLLAVWFVYSIAGIRSLSGTASSAKWAAFLVAAIGICIPILNLFPLILIWTTVVWRYPK